MYDSSNSRFYSYDGRPIFFNRLTCNNSGKNWIYVCFFFTSFALVSLHVKADLLFGPGDEARLKQALADLVSQKFPKR